MALRETSFLRNLNPDLELLKGPEGDYVYHYGVHSIQQADELKEVFGKTRAVVQAGSGHRAYRNAKQLAEGLGGFFTSVNKEPERDMDTMEAVDEKIQDVIYGRRELLSVMYELEYMVAKAADLPVKNAKDERFWTFVAETEQAGTIVSVSHGMGTGSHSIMLNEMVRILHHAGADLQEDPFEFMRLGTSGGLGLEAGDIVIADRGLEPSGKARYRAHVLGVETEFPTNLDPKMSRKLYDSRKIPELEGKKVVIGSTVACGDFFIDQARRDGAIKTVPNEKAKIDYLQRLYDEHGARNMEMEATGFAFFCEKLGIPAACVNTTLLNRLHGDQVTSTSEQLASFSDGPTALAIEYFKRNPRAEERT